MLARKLLIAAGIAGSVLTGAAQAAIVVNVNGAFDNKASYTEPTSGITFTASAGGLLNTTNILGTNDGVGVDRTSVSDNANEIEIGETITLSTIPALAFASFKVGLLFDGPEFGDYQEIATFTGTNLTGAESIYRLTATYTSAAGVTATWSGPGTVVNLSPAVQPGGAAVWQVNNPFGDQVFSSLVLGAEPGLCAPGLTCTSQSDYALMQVALVPEPSEYAMMLAGLAAVGFMVRRRRNAAA